MNAVLLVAHAPLAQALRQAALHVLPEAAADVLAVDVQAQAAPEQSLALARAALAQLGQRRGVLILTDVVGATPCNVASRLVRPSQVELLAGVNLPMLLRALSYRGESLEMMSARAVAGGVQGIRSVPAAVPQVASAASP